jgi:hypothetical protein
MTNLNGDAACWAVRYCLGRMTYVSQSCADWLERAWPEFDERTRDHIRNDVEEAFRRDDGARANGHSSNALGMDCDREQWRRVRRLWQGGA